MQKFAAIINVVAGSLITLIGTFVVLRLGAFLWAAPHGHYRLIVWAFLVIAVGIYLVIGGLGRVLHGTSRMMYDEDQPEDF